MSSPPPLGANDAHNRRPLWAYSDGNDATLRRSVLITGRDADDAPITVISPHDDADDAASYRPSSTYF